MPGSRAGDDPGPAGRLLPARRRLAERDPLEPAVRLARRPKERMSGLLDQLEVPLHYALEDVGDAAKTLAAGEGPAIGKMAAVSMRRRPDAELLALWLADAVLATASDRRAADCRPNSPQRLGDGRLRP